MNKVSFEDLKDEMLRLAYNHPDRKNPRVQNGTYARYITYSGNIEDNCRCLMGQAFHNLGIPDSFLKELDVKTFRGNPFAFKFALKEVSDANQGWLVRAQRKVDRGAWGDYVVYVRENP